MTGKLMLFILTFLIPFGAQAKSAGYLQVSVAELRPTQAVIGHAWAEEKCGKFAEMSKGELAEYLEEETPPAVVGPGGRVYLLDNHHELFCLNKLGVKESWIKVAADLSNLSMAQFERTMIENHWLYLGDENGELTMTLAKMPKSVSELRNDPYRGLASRVRKAGGFDKVKRPFVEFIWANHLRQVVPLKILLEHPELAVKLGIAFAQSAEASRLPGYNGSYKPSQCEKFLNPSA